MEIGNVTGILTGIEPASTHQGPRQKEINLEKRKELKN
jgi:hypothetical protein